MSVDTSKASIRTSLKRVRGLGSAHHGTSDFFRQRLTAIAMILLFVPVIVVILSLLGRNQAGAAAILGSPLVAVVMILFIIASVWHMKIGMQVIIEDYVHAEGIKIGLLMLNTFFAILVGGLCLFAVLKIAFAG